MASVEQCDAALRALATRFSQLEPDAVAKYVLDRTVSCRVSDLKVTWWAHLTQGGLLDITQDADTRAQVRLSVSSDDLISLTEGRLAVPTAVAMGKIRVQASPFDLLRLSHFL